MKKDLHKPLNRVVFVCASCSTKIEIGSTLNDKEKSIDVCSACHPFYVGTAVNQQVKGRAEKFNKKIVAEAKPATKKDEKSSKKQNKKVVSLSNL